MRIKHFFYIVFTFLLIANAYLLYLIDKNKDIMKMAHYARNYEFLYQSLIQKKITTLSYEQFALTGTKVYWGVDSTNFFSIEMLTQYPKLVFGSSQDMCPPCILDVIDIIKEIYPNYMTNDRILFVADVEQRLKENYHDKTVLNFLRKFEFPLYDFGAPYLFILDEDINVKMLFITDKENTGLTKEYLKLIKKIFPDL